MLIRGKNMAKGKVSAIWKAYRLRRRMRRIAMLLIEARLGQPELLRYLERLEMRIENQERELRMLRWAVSGEQMADWDHEQDIWDWHRKGGQVAE
jgi:hypothetical protein